MPHEIETEPQASEPSQLYLQMYTKQYLTWVQTTISIALQAYSVALHFKYALMATLK